jgi:hypothetical protein
VLPSTVGIRIFKFKVFTRFAEKEGITDTELKNLVCDVLEAGLGVNLGSGVYKIRIARQGRGQSGGYRAIIFFKRGKRTFFRYGFAKSDLDNISQKELRLFKEIAHEFFVMDDEQIKARVKAKHLQEIT